MIARIRKCSEILARELHRPVTVINAGISGLPVQCTVQRLEHELLRFNPDGVVFYEGFNNIPSGIRDEFRFQARGSLLQGDLKVVIEKNGSAVNSTLHGDLCAHRSRPDYRNMVNLLDFSRRNRGFGFWLAGRQCKAAPHSS